jgi:class 3 adenylate cyclase/tetratricopeptide (TPR) repeat protein
VVVCPACGEENPERARFCLACGGALVAESAGGEERKVVSVLFVDLVGFTDRSDRADPEDVRATLRPYHERVKADIEAFGGTVEKFIGDAVMAVFGAPVSHEDDAERAVRAALRVLETMETLRREGLDVAVRAAVTTGAAVVALGARPERGEGIVAGDVVNIAARLQSAAPVGAAIVDATTMRSAERAIAFEPLEPVAAKGKQERIPVWRAMTARSRFGVDTELRAETLFVGRDSELALLGETFLRALREPSTQLVTVIAEPGVGKSRLVWEFREEIDRRPDLVRWRQGRCLPYGDGITFWALGEIVKAEAGVLESDSPAQALEKLVRAADVVEDESDRAWVTERLAPLVGAQDEVAGVGREEAFSAWRRYVEALAAQRPTVLVIEDLHWADEALLDFVEPLLDWTAEVPLMVLATARPELYDARPGWGGGRRNSTTLGLSPLSDEDTARLVASLLERSVMPAETQAALLERAGGNPLYAEQFVRMLGEAGATAGGDLPETIQALIAARLDTLTPELKNLVQDASVLGKVFWTGALVAMGAHERHDVFTGLRELVRREFVRPARVSSMRDEEEFSFWHVLVRDVAYQQIPRAARGRKHVDAAEWIEQASEGRVADQADFLAHHYAQALELGRASGNTGDVDDLEERLVRFSILSGDRAMSLDIPAAEGAYRRALAWVTDDAERGRVLGRLADSLQPQGRLTESEEAYDEAIALLQAAGEDHAAGVAMGMLGRALWRHGETVRARQGAADAVALLEASRDSDLVLGYSRLAALDALGGRSEQAVAWAEKAIELAREIGFENTSRALGMRGLARLDLRDPGGLEDLRASVELALELRLPAEDTAIAYGNLGENVALAEGVGRGRELVEAGLEFARGRGHLHHVMYSRSTLLQYLFHEGRWDELLRESDEVIAWDRERGGTQLEPWAAADTGWVLAHRGEVSKAEALVGAVLPRAREIADPQTILPLLLNAAFLALTRGDLSRADALLVEYTERITETRAQSQEETLCVWLVMIALGVGGAARADALLSGYEPWSACGRHSLVHGRALIAQAAGRSDEATLLFADAAGGWKEWGAVPFRAYALLGLGACADDEAARTEAMEIFARLGARPVTPHVVSARQQQV